MAWEQQLLLYFPLAVLRKEADDLGISTLQKPATTPEPPYDSDKK